MDLYRQARCGLVTTLLALTVAGCSTPSRITNQPIASVESVDYSEISTGRNKQRSSDVELLLAFSGGGTRAAAFSYGVLKKLRDTVYTMNGEERRLVDDIDRISSVSGGSFTAAYYGLFGERIFEDYERAFLRGNVQNALIRSLLNPLNWFNVGNRTEVAVNYYDKHIFRGSTFADIHANDGPLIEINATDLGNGERFTFTQQQFDMLCSDLDSFPVARAVTASSAVPVVFSPVVLENHEGCDYQDPQYITIGRQKMQGTLRTATLIEHFDSYKDKENRRYIHLIDGGITDNLGIRNITNRIEVAGDVASASKVFSFAPKYIIVIVVNAETHQTGTMELSNNQPASSQVISAVTNAQLSRYNIESLSLLKRYMKQAAVELSTPERPVKPFLITLNFNSIADEKVRLLFNSMATSFSLPDEEIDKLIEAGERLLEASPEFQEAITTLREEMR